MKHHRSENIEKCSLEKPLFVIRRFCEFKVNTFKQFVFLFDCASHHLQLIANRNRINTFVKTFFFKNSSTEWYKIVIPMLGKNRYCAVSELHGMVCSKAKIGPALQLSKKFCTEQSRVSGANLIKLLGAYLGA